jgi:peptide/nickel transport system substrate-binding protein
MTPKLRIVAAAAAVGATVPLAMPAFAASQTPANTLIDGTTDTVTSIDPAGQYDFGSDTADREIFQHLMVVPPGGGAPVPELATSCKAGDTTAVWICKLREGVKFHNGDDFTAEDVKFSFDRVNKIHDSSGIWTLLNNLDNVTIDGPHQVTFNLKKPQATWPSILGTSAAYIVDHKVYSADKLRPSTDTQVGTGPYKLVKYVPGQTAVYKAWDGYWGDKPKVPNLIITYFSKSSTMKLALQKGELDMVFRSFTPTELGSLEKQKDLKVWKGPGVAIRYLSFNVTREPTSNPAVRKAIAYLFPREAIAKRVYHGFVKPLYSMVPAGLPGHIDAFATVYGNTPDQAKAAKVLKDAGVKTPVDITMWWTPSHYGAASAEEYTEIQRALNASKLFDVKLKSAEWATYSKTLGTQYNAFQLGWFPDYPDAENYLLPFYLKKNFLSSGYDDPDMQKLLSDEQTAKTDEERMTYVKKAQMLAAKDAPIIPYYQGSMVAVANKNVQGIDKTLDTAFVMRFWMLTKS